MINVAQDFMKMNPFMNMFDYGKMQNPMKMYEDFFKNSQNMFMNNDVAKNFNKLYEQYNDMVTGVMKKCDLNNSHKDKATHNVYNQMHEMLNMVMKNMGFISQMAQEINNDSQAIFRKKSKMLQTQVSELFSLMKKITSAPNPELSMSLHADFIKDSFERMLNNMQELSKDYNNFGVENFDKMNKKLSQLFTNFQNSANKTTVKANN